MARQAWQFPLVVQKGGLKRNVWGTARDECGVAEEAVQFSDYEFYVFDAATANAIDAAMVAHGWPRQSRRGIVQEMIEAEEDDFVMVHDQLFWHCQEAS